MSRFQAVVMGAPGRLDFANISEFTTERTDDGWTGVFVTSGDASALQRAPACDLYQYIEEAGRDTLTYRFRCAVFNVDGDTVKFSASHRMRI